MRFADLVAEVALPDPRANLVFRQTDEPPQEQPAPGKLLISGVEADVEDLEQLGERLRYVRVELARLKKEEELLKGAILTHPEARGGYQNSFIEVGTSNSLVADDEVMLKYLRTTGNLERVLEAKISVKKLRRLGAELRGDKLDEPSDLEKLFIFDQGRRLKVRK